MNDAIPPRPHARRTPFHLWVVGLVSVLWNGWGVALAVGAQTDRLPDLDAETSAYFDAQPLWFILFADLAPLAGIAGSVALLLQSRSAAGLFAVHLGILVLCTVYELAIGTSLLLSNPESRVGILLLVALICGQIAYARGLRRRGVLY